MKRGRETFEKVYFCGARLCLRCETHLVNRRPQPKVMPASSATGGAGNLTLHPSKLLFGAQDMSCAGDVIGDRDVTQLKVFAPLFEKSGWGSGRRPEVFYKSAKEGEPLHWYSPCFVHSICFATGVASSDSLFLFSENYFSSEAFFSVFEKRVLFVSTIKRNGIT